MIKNLNCIIFSTIITFSIILWGCNNSDQKVRDDEIVVSILPQKTFIEKIAGKNIPIKVLIPPGASPSTYEMKPSQLKSISNSAIWFRVGHIGFEKTWSKKIKEVNKEMEVINLSENIKLIESSHNHEDVMHYGTDPHIWLSPKNVEIMANSIYRELIKLQPENKNLFKQNLTNFINEIENTDEAIQEILKDKSTRDFIIFHPSLGYFAQDYGLHQHSIEFEGKEPKPKHLKAMIDFAKENNIKIILIQKEFDKEMARTIAEEIDAKVIVIDPLSENWSENLLKIANNISNE